MLGFAPFRASLGGESPSWRHPKQRKAGSCRQEPAGENRDEKEEEEEEAPASPSPAAAEPGSRVAEHVIHGRKLEIKGEERARARCHPRLLPKVCTGGGKHPQTHTLAHPTEPAPLARGVTETHGVLSLLPAPRRRQSQAEVNEQNKTKTPNRRRCFFTRGFPVPRVPRRFPAKAAGAGRVRQEQLPSVTPKKQLFLFLGGFFFLGFLLKQKKPAASCLGPRKARGRV